MKFRSSAALTAAAIAALCGAASGQVFINEVFINPPGSANDDIREFIEIHGTPFRKLDGYAVAMLSGSMRKHYILGALAGGTPDAQEIDEFFSLDGLSLGANGLLVIGIGAASNYPTLLSDTNFRRWNTIWNGGLDTPGKLNNDGSNTIMLIRRRPGATQADPGNPLGLRWGKDIDMDAEYITPVESTICIGGPANGSPCNSAASDCFGNPCDDGFVDQFGDGKIDRGNPDGYGGFTLDMIGFTTPFDLSDDLEVVDEVSYEHERGWEYDTDDRKVDVGSTSGKLPQRRVHALDDPQGLNPDALSRVDYRTKGPGWMPVAGAVGEGPGGMNWQDTATEQWIRGESFPNNNPPFHYDNSPNSNPDAVQPYLTHVPTWLNDGVGVEYSFTPSSYEIAAGRVNPLAVAFIPGDSNRDGVCNQDDIDKIAAVFGEDDWIFSNSWGASPEGNDGDPATQTRPWDVDGSGDNGIDPNDLQWALNFQGNTNGRIVGVRYDSTTPSATGVYLNPNTGVGVRITATIEPECDGGTGLYYVGDEFTLVVWGEVNAGANNAAGQHNGISQFSHDLAISGGGGVMQVVSVEALSSFVKTREALETLTGADGDTGILNINGYTKSFTEGLSGPTPLYAVKLRTFDLGAVTVSVGPAVRSQFAAGAPRGVKVARTRGGDPATSTYLATVAFDVALECRADFDRTGFVDTDDYDSFVRAFEDGDQCADFDLSGFVDTDDFDAFVRAFEAGC
ncbi:MAG: hypothetical protein KF787_09895 [Phycisphaeraceae bacterium]|nr:hypothetical protein [Phycisphaerae bacterium]MBX3392945.1 hypothetical protein [Phycisphaeraceae bacterium]